MCALLPIIVFLIRNTVSSRLMIGSSNAQALAILRLLPGWKHSATYQGISTVPRLSVLAAAISLEDVAIDHVRSAVRLESSIEQRG